MGQTTGYQIPYPELDEPDDVPTDMHELALRVDALFAAMQARNEEGQPNGYAGLDAGGKVPAAQLPPPASTITPYRKVSVTDILNTTAARQDVFGGELNIEAGKLTATGKIVLEAGGDYLNGSTGARTLIPALLLGGAVLWESPGFSLPVSPNRRSWRLAVTIHALDATHVRASGLFVMSSEVLATTGAGAVGNTQSTNEFLGPIYGVSAVVVPTAPMALVFGITHSSASASISMRCGVARAEVS